MSLSRKSLKRSVARIGRTKRRKSKGNPRKTMSRQRREEVRAIRKRRKTSGQGGYRDRFGSLR